MLDLERVPFEDRGRMGYDGIGTHCHRGTRGVLLNRRPRRV